MAKTSLSHPLLIGAVVAGSRRARIGMTFCPGKYDPRALTGSWERDLALDLDAVRDWGAAVVVTLLQPYELKLLRVEKLGDEVTKRGMAWLHLPIADGGVPDPAFELQWQVAGAGLRTLLQGGCDVLIHCRGGLGRTGTIGARLLVELGREPKAAIALVRKARPGAVENAAQETHVLAAERMA